MARVTMLHAALERAGLLQVVVDAAGAHHVTVEDVLGDGHGPSSVRARVDCYVALYVDFGRSSKEVGRLLGRDHTTVLAAFDRIGLVRRPRPGMAKASPSAQIRGVA